MLFTKIWTAVLAVLATACLAGMYLLSTGSSGGFDEADEAAVRAITEAGMAALASDINASPVSLGPSVLGDTRLKEALERPAVGDEEEGSLVEIFDTVAYESLLNQNPLMSMAVVDKSGNILARAGFDKELFDQAVKAPGVSDSLTFDEDRLISASLGGKLHAVKVSRPLAQNRRLVTIQAVELGGGSFFRRVVGTENPAGLVQDGAIFGEAIGSAKTEELTGWLGEHLKDVPPEGASQAFQLGKGPNARLGAAARVPGPAGKGQAGLVFVVLSGKTLSSTKTDMQTALKVALAKGGLGPTGWGLVAGLLIISLVLTFYLPFLEYNTPLRRLMSEFNGITEGKQHEINHDRYGGEVGRVGKAAQLAMEALRVSWEEEMSDIDPSSSGVRSRTHSTRSLRGVGRRRGSTRSNKRVTGSQDAVREEPQSSSMHEDDDDVAAIDLPGASPSPVERHASAEGPARKKKAAARPAPSLSDPEPAAAPAFNDEVSAGPIGFDDDDSISLADAGQDRESYYKSIYKEFVETKQACGENVDSFPYEKFAKKLRKQSDSLLAKPEVKDVEFSVYVKDGKAALKAKIIKV